MSTEQTHSAVTVRRKSLPLARYRLMVGYRFLLAIVGGYLLAALVAVVISLAFPAQLASAAMAGTLLAFALHTGVFIFVFMVHSTRKATLGIFIPLIVLALAYWFLKK